MKAVQKATSRQRATSTRTAESRRDGAGVEVNLEAISKRFRSVVALQPTTLSIRPGRMTALLGPSGCGKTTTLRMLAGLEAPDEGRILIDGKDMTRTPPNKRGLGMVFQSYSLFPHMTVGENVAFGLRMAGADQGTIATRVAEMLELVRLPHVEERYPAQLSGGQQQRVALARALVTDPAVLLLDEPLAALDRHLREEMQFELRRIQTSLQITTVIVTHDQEEALTMSDDVVVMSHGRIVQSGAPDDIYNKPQTRFVAEFLGTANLFDGVANESGQVRFVDGPARGGLFAQGVAGNAGLQTVAVRPEKMWVRPHSGLTEVQSGNPQLALPGEVIGRVFRGNNYIFQVAVAGREAPVIVYLQATDLAEVGLNKGDRVSIGWKPENAVVLSQDEAGASLAGAQK